MSLHPENAYCPDCNGVIPLGQFGRNLKSRCKCGERDMEAVRMLSEPVEGDPFGKRFAA